MTMQQTKTTSHAISSMYLRWRNVLNHKVHIYLEFHSVCPLVGIGTDPPPLPPASVCVPPPLNQRGGGARSPAGKGVGESHFGWLEKKLSTQSTYSMGPNFNHHSRLLKSTLIFFSSANLQVQDNQFERRRGKESFIHDKNDMETLPVPETKGCLT